MLSRYPWASHADFSGSFQWAPLELMRTAFSSDEANGLPEAHGPPEVHEPRGHCIPCPPPPPPPPRSRWTCVYVCYSAAARWTLVLQKVYLRMCFVGYFCLFFLLLETVSTNWSYFSVVQCYQQARSQKFAMGGLFWGSGGGAPSRRRPMGVWGRSPQPPEAGGLGAKPPAAGGTGVWGRSPQRSKILHFFCKNNFILGLFWLKNNAFKTWLRNWQCKQD